MAHITSQITAFIVFLAFPIAFFPSILGTIIELPFRLFCRRAVISPVWPVATSCAALPSCSPLASTLSCQPALSPTPTLEATGSMSWFQKTISLPPKSRGSYLITSHIESSLPEIQEYKVGLLNLFVQHTSCALSLNENWDEDVRADMSDALDRIVPEDKRGQGLYRHDAEGSDDMPVWATQSNNKFLEAKEAQQAHVKSALIGASVTIPISNGRLATGTWQGIWYLEFRAARHSRKVVATIQGEKS
jgi:secondary thiamine-phosphate synthase enzyme